MPRPTRTPARRSTTSRKATLTVAVTGAGGTLGPPLLDRLAGSPTISRIVLLGRHRTAEMARHPDVEFHHVDVRDAATVERTIARADVVVHMAFSLYGLGMGERELFATNVEGTLNVARAAARAGARRFVYTSSAAVYGGRSVGHRPLREDDPWHASARLFYARHKAQAEVVVGQALAESGTEPYVMRPCAIVGPHAAGALGHRVPSGLAGSVRRLARLGARAGLRPALPPPPVPLQFVHEDDVAQALTLAVEGRGEAGVYNLAGDGALSGPDTLRLLGFRALPLPRPLVGGALRTLRLMPPVLPGLAWPELLDGSLVIDTDRARRRLGWKPRWSSADALRATRAALGW
jgi:UDP-glucose 4-epimerase